MSRNKLSDLSHDCLLEIFNYLNFDDMISISEISSEFDQILIQMISRNYELNVKRSISTNSMQTFLHKFQPKIEKLCLPLNVEYLQNWDLFKKRLDLISSHINDEHLKVLDLHANCKKSMELLGLRNMLNKLQCAEQIVIRYLDDPNDENILNWLLNFRALQSMEFDNCHLDFRLMPCAVFSNLNSLKIVNCHMWLDMNIFSKLLKTNDKKLKELEFHLSDTNFLCEELEELVNLVVKLAPNLISFGIKLDSSLMDECEHS